MPKQVDLQPESPASTLRVSKTKTRPPKVPKPRKKDLVPDTFLMEGWFPAGTETSVRYTTDFPVDNEVTVLHVNLTDMTQEQAAADILADLDAGAYVTASALGNEVTLAPEGGAAVVTVVEVLVTNPPEEPQDPGDSTDGGTIGGDPAIIQMTGSFVAGTIIEMDYTTDIGGVTTAEYTVPENFTGLQLAQPYAQFIDTMPDLIADDVGDLIYIWPELPATSVTLLAFRITAPPGSGTGGENNTDGAYVLTASSDITMASSTEQTVTRFAQLLESMTANSLLDYTLTIMAEVSDELTVGDSTELNRQLLAELMDQIDVYAFVKTASDVAQGWVMNTEGAQPISEYDNYDFNSLAYFHGEFYGTNDNGLYKMGGDLDAGVGITAAMSSLMLDMGTSRQKRIRSAYLGYTSTNELVLKVRAVSDGQLFEHWYKAQPISVADAPREGYVRVGQGLKSRYWQFELTNIDGGDFEIDQLELYPLMLNRRI